MTRYLPHPKVVVTEWDADGYPSTIIVEIGDPKNTKMEFVPKITQPEPHMVIGDRLAKMLRDNTYGYPYEGKHRKKAGATAIATDR